MENVKKFYDALATDEAMRKKAEDLNKKFEGAQPDENAVKAEIISFAEAAGYTFTAEELDAYANRMKPLSESELEVVAGGRYKESNCFCAFGGGGKDSETGNKCACVAGGGGKRDGAGNCLICVVAGTIGNPDAETSRGR